MVREAERLETLEREKEMKRMHKGKCMSKESSKNMEKPKKIILEKLKLTNPVPFSLSESRTKAVRPKKIEIERVNKAPVVHLSQIPMMVDLPEYSFKEGRKKESLVETIRRLERRSFFESFRRDIESVVDDNKHRYS